MSVFMCVCTCVCSCVQRPEADISLFTFCTEAGSLTWACLPSLGLLQGSNLYFLIAEVKAAMPAWHLHESWRSDSGLYVLCLYGKCLSCEQSHRPRIMFLKVRFMSHFHLNHRFIANILVHGLYSRWIVLASWIKSHRSAFTQAT